MSGIPLPPPPSNSPPMGKSAPAKPCTCNDGESKDGGSTGKAHAPSEPSSQAATRHEGLWTKVDDDDDGEPSDLHQVLTVSSSSKEHVGKDLDVRLPEVHENV